MSAWLGLLFEKVGNFPGAGEYVDGAVYSSPRLRKYFDELALRELECEAETFMTFIFFHVRP